MVNRILFVVVIAGVSLIGFGGCGKSVEVGALPTSPGEQESTTPAPKPDPVNPKPPLGKGGKCDEDHLVRLVFQQPNPIVTAISLEPAELTSILGVLVNGVEVGFDFDHSRSMILLDPAQAGSPGAVIHLDACAVLANTTPIIKGVSQ